MNSRVLYTDLNNQTHVLLNDTPEACGQYLIDCRIALSHDTAHPGTYTAEGPITYPTPSPVLAPYLQPGTPLRLDTIASPALTKLGDPSQHTAEDYGNDNRAARAILLGGTYEPDDIKASFTDILCDILHACDALNWHPNEIINEAVNHHAIETGAQPEA